MSEPDSGERLLAAAVEAFAERGYAATTTREIARRAGFSPAGMYVHHASKADVLAAISRAGHTAVLDAVRGALAGVDDPAQRLHRFVAAFVAWHARNHTLARVVQYELRALPPGPFAEIRDRRRELVALLEAELDRGITAGAFRVDARDATVSALLSLGIDVARWWTPRAPAPDVLGEEYAALALRMVQAVR